jgi:hypothetical protein
MDAIDWGLKPSATDDSFEHSAFETIKLLVRRFPDDGAIAAKDAEQCGQEMNPRNREFNPTLAPDECIRRYKHCIALTPHPPWCAEGLEWSKQAYVDPFCTASNIKSTISFRAASVDAKTRVKAKVRGKEYPTDEPFLRGADIAAIHSTIHQPSSDSKGTKERSILLRFEIAPSAREAVKKMRATIEGNQAEAAALFDGTTSLGAAFGYHLDEEGREIEISDVELDRVCKKPEHRELPHE